MINKPKNYCKSCKKAVPKEYKNCVKCCFKTKRSKQ